MYMRSIYILLWAFSGGKKVCENGLLITGLRQSIGEKSIGSPFSLRQWADAFYLHLICTSLQVLMAYLSQAHQRAQTKEVLSFKKRVF